MKKPIVGITMGDPAGIGPEICVKAIADGQILGVSKPIIIGDSRLIDIAAQICKAENLQINSIQSINQANFKSPYIINVLDLKNADPHKFKMGEVSKVAGKAAVEYIEKAIQLALKKEIEAIATAPINKASINIAGYKFQGHTELLAERTKTKEFGMMFVSDYFWLILVTTHVAVKNISKNIDKAKVLKAIKLAHQTMSKINRRKPKIGVAGLNPHAGESGIFGKEEIKYIEPAIKEAKKLGINVEGPFSPDAIFNLAKAGMFEIVVAMYHDQGLIPLKLLSFNRSVNVTVGLPIIRTSVDHGTGFNIVGKGWANPGSLIEAIKVASLMASHS